MALIPWQYSYNGLTLGAGTPFGVTEVTGLRELPPIRKNDLSRARGDGAYAGQQYADERIAQFTFTVAATGTLAAFEQNLENLASAFAPIVDPAQLKVLQFYPGNLGIGRAVQVTGRPTRGGYPINKNQSIGFTDSLVIEFTCPDPLIYDSVLQSVTTGLPSPTSGLAFPVTFPASFGSSTGGSMSVTNSGNYATGALITIHGPCTNPSVSLGSATLKFNITLGSTDTLVIDTSPGVHSVTLNGTASRNNTIAGGSTWFVLPPGSSTIGFASTDATQVSGTCTVQFRNAWSWL